ncbi:MAG: hypothetical protein JNM56_09990 [Planctomycetia bacterium]|nr:hypothetical protein [Planctomycetia bacterium]
MKSDPHALSGVAVGLLWMLGNTCFGLAAPEPKVSVTVALEHDTIFRGESIQLTLKILNEGKEPVWVLHPSVALQTLGIDFELEGAKTGRVRRTLKPSPPVAPKPADFVELAAGESLTHACDLTVVTSLRPSQADSYTLTALVRVDQHLLRSPAVALTVVEVPPLKGLQRSTLERSAQAGKYWVRADVGLAPAAKDQLWLLVVLSRTNAGEDPQTFHKQRVLRLTTLTPQTKLQSGIVGGSGIEQPADLHVLLTDLKNAQCYWVIAVNGSQVTRTENFKEAKVRMSQPDAQGGVTVIIER